MICSQDDAPCSHKTPVKYKNILNTASSLKYCLFNTLQLFFCGCRRAITSINQTCASILAVVYVLLGRAVTECRWGGSRNIVFMRHKFLVLTVKKLLKSVYIYRSYRKIKTGVSLFLDHPVLKQAEPICALMLLCVICDPILCVPVYLVGLESCWNFYQSHVERISAKAVANPNSDWGMKIAFLDTIHEKCKRKICMNLTVDMICSLPCNNFMLSKNLLELTSTTSPGAFESNGLHACLPHSTRGTTSVYMPTFKFLLAF